MYEEVKRKLKDDTIPTFSQLDFKINKREIKNYIEELKNVKSLGEDGIFNEMIKSCRDILLPLLEKLFNMIFLLDISHIFGK